MFKKNALFSLVFTTAMLLLPLTQAEAAGTQLGILKCEKIPGSEKNLLIHSSAGFECEYTSQAGFKQKYKGEAGITLGLDLSWTKESTIAYAVMGVEGAKAEPGELVGTYSGATASAAFGLGVGAKVLVGGGNSNIALSPLALEGSKGLGASAGIGYLTLVKE
jgi:hypothetical protein